MAEVLSQHPAAPRRTVGGWIWFVVMIGGWSPFFSLA